MSFAPRSGRHWQLALVFRRAALVMCWALAIFALALLLGSLLHPVAEFMASDRFPLFMMTIATALLFFFLSFAGGE